MGAKLKSNDYNHIFYNVHPMYISLIKTLNPPRQHIITLIFSNLWLFLIWKLQTENSHFPQEIIFHSGRLTSNLQTAKCDTTNYSDLQTQGRLIDWNGIDT